MGVHSTVAEPRRIRRVTQEMLDEDRRLRQMQRRMFPGDKNLLPGSQHKRPA